MLEMYFDNWEKFGHMMAALKESGDLPVVGKFDFVQTDEFLEVRWFDNEVVPTNVLNEYTRWWEQY